jgi:hypothetical protein
MYLALGGVVMNTTIKRNIDHYSQYMTQDNIFGIDTISKFTQKAYFFTTNSTESTALKQCKRQGFKPDTSKYWGYQCYYLDESGPVQRLFKYAVNWAENRPRPTYYKNLAPIVVSRGRAAVEEYNSIIGFQDMTFCIVNVAIHIAEFGATRLAKSIVSYNANDFYNMLEKHDREKLDYNGYDLLEIEIDQAMDLSEKGLCVFAIKKQNPIGHMAPVIGRNVWVNRNNSVKVTTEEKCPWCLNIGRKDLDGYNSIYRSFYVTNLNDIKYYVLVNKYV